jgi:hypothetical protein
MIYLASPYSHPSTLVREFRFRVACEVASKMMRDGKCVFSHIAHTHPIALAGALPLGWEYWQRYDREMIGACSELAVVTLDGWKESIGVNAEIAIARELGKDVWYTPPY